MLLAPNDLEPLLDGRLVGPDGLLLEPDDLEPLLDALLGGVDPRALGDERPLAPLGLVFRFGRVRSDRRVLPPVAPRRAGVAALLALGRRIAVVVPAHLLWRRLRFHECIVGQRPRGLVERGPGPFRGRRLQQCGRLGRQEARKRESRASPVAASFRALPQLIELRLRAVRNTGRGLLNGSDRRFDGFAQLAPCVAGVEGPRGLALPRVQETGEGQRGALAVALRLGFRARRRCVARWRRCHEDGGGLFAGSRPGSPGPCRRPAHPCPAAPAAAGRHPGRRHCDAYYINSALAF